MTGNSIRPQITTLNKPFMKRLLSLVFILAATALGATLSAQDVKITGRVTVAGSNEPLPYASVTTSEGLVGVNTDMEGRYSISVPPKSTLVFSFIGYKTKEVALTPAMTSVDVVLE